MISVTFITASFDAMIQRVENALARERVVDLAAGYAAREIKDNFLRLDAERSFYGHHFYNREGNRKTRTEKSNDGKTARILIDSVQMLHKLQGGTVRPVNGKFLAIPVSDWAKAQKRNPRDIRKEFRGHEGQSHRR